MTERVSDFPMTEVISKRSDVLFVKHKQKIYEQTDRMFAALMSLQWLGGIIAALWITPQTWLGEVHYIHVHVWAAVYLGSLISFPPILLALFRCGKTSTRYVISAAQMLTSALLIHISGGRIETHFHVFGSLAFLAMYRDWKVLVPATIVVAVDHWVRGVYYPQSVFGVLTAEPWRWVEHAAWVVFEDIFLVISCLRSVREIREIADRTAALEMVNQQIETTVVERTRELKASERVLRSTLEELTTTQTQLIQADRLAAIGQLAAGIAHEINNPVGFVTSNLSTLDHYMVAFSEVFRATSYLKKIIANEKDLEKATRYLEELNQLEEKLNLDLILKDVGNLIHESKNGAKRIVNIVNDLKTFARSDKSIVASTNLHEIIDSITNIVWNEVKYKAELKKEYGQLSLVLCNGQQMGQVFMNILVNAAQAIPDKGIITIRTYEKNGWAYIEITDTGKGIPPEIMNHIFTPFFTTKEAGKGTGLGLSISYDIINKHGGKIDVKSEVGKGTKFTVGLPIQTNVNSELQGVNNKDGHLINTKEINDDSCKTK